MIDIGNPIGNPNHAGLHGVIRRTVGVVQDAHAGFIAEIEPLEPFLQSVHHAERLLIVMKSRGKQGVQRPLSGMAEGCVSQIVSQGNGLSQVLVQT